ncbi:MAG: LamG domain-containing protein [Chthoniobacterales bacterium]|nr:LamG domain-containing protein [Chthoniobacterales bacterium]
MKTTPQKFLLLALASCLPVFCFQAQAQIWTSAIGLYEFNNNLNDSNGLASSGTSWQRSTDSAVSAVYSNVGSSTLPGWDGVALSLASTRYVNLGQGASNEFQITGDLTLFARVNVTGTGTTLAIISKDGTAGNRSYALRLENITGSGGTLSSRFNGATTISHTSASITTGKWMDLAVVFDANDRIELYLDGVSVSTITSGVPASLTNNSTTPLLFGAVPQGSPIGADNWTGLMERAAIWNTALTDAEVLSLSVPEPQTVAMILSAGFFVVLWRIRRRRGQRI